MNAARIAKNVILAGTVWRLAALRRDASARQRRARRIAPLLITAAGAGVLLVARPRILEAARRLWVLAWRQSNGEPGKVGRGSRPDVETVPRARRKAVVAHPRKRAPVRPRKTGKKRTRPRTEPEPGGTR